MWYVRSCHQVGRWRRFGRRRMLQLRTGRVVVFLCTRQHAKDMCVPVNNHISSSSPSSELQIEERWRKVQQAKERLTCPSCGQTGHWAGDDKCRARNGGSKGLAKAVPEERKAHFSRGFDMLKYPSTAGDHRNVCSSFQATQEGESLPSQARLESIPFQAQPRKCGRAQAPFLARTRMMGSDKLSVSLRSSTIVKTKMMKMTHTILLRRQFTLFARGRTVRTIIS